jgi:hypothetical protein
LENTAGFYAGRNTKPAKRAEASKDAVSNFDFMEAPE